MARASEHAALKTYQPVPMRTREPPTTSARLLKSKAAVEDLFDARWHEVLIGRCGVERPEQMRATRLQYARDLARIRTLTSFIQTVKAADIEATVVRAFDLVEVGHVPDQEFGACVVSGHARPSLANRYWREVDSGDADPLLRHIARKTACAATKLEDTLRLAVPNQIGDFLRNAKISPNREGSQVGLIEFVAGGGSHTRAFKRSGCWKIG